MESISKLNTSFILIILNRQKIMQARKNPRTVEMKRGRERGRERRSERGEGKRERERERGEKGEKG